MGAVQVLKLADPRVGLVHRLQVPAGSELHVAVMLSEVALDATVGVRSKGRAAVHRLHVTKVIADHPQELLHAGETVMVHDCVVDFRRRLVLDRNPVVASSLEGGQDSLSGGHARSFLPATFAHGVQGRMEKVTSVIGIFTARAESPAAVLLMPL